MMDTKLNIPSSEELAGLPQDGGPDFNRLVFEKSPYLLQHARNPVNWYSWGEEAFQQARDLDRPVFLSIGYSTCHWCHVMEKESFEDPEVAELLNAGFVAIKVDREERPDIDQIYMAVCQAVTGMGGWPLTVILTPDRKPFFAGTYFPKESRFGRTGMLELLPKVSQLWAEKRDQLISSAEQITDQIKQTAAPAPGMLQQGIIQAAYLDLHARFDRLYGGFGSAPKFPAAHNLLFLLRFWRQTGEPQALEMVERTLDRMRLGGIYDQVGFGFHRYSTDEAWLLPHFEKMLYDQALLAMAYTEAFLATGKELYSRIAREVLSYVRRDLSSHAGGFYSAEDADSEGEEGLFYLWGVDEFQTVLGKENGNLFGGLFNLKPEGNYYDEAQKARTGRNILYLKRDLAELAGEHSLDPGQLNDLWERQRRLLFSARESRIHPLKDDKVLTDWNGLMITALARAGAALAEPDFLAAAEKAADFIWNELRDPAGRLLKRYRDGEAGLPAHLDDYAFLIWGLIEIYQARFNAEYLARALELTEVMIADFWDGRDGGFFLSRAGQKDLIMRAKEIYDGAIPSGNSAAAFILIRLARLTGRPDLEEKADRIGQAFAHQVNNLPLGYTFLLTAQLFAAGPSFEVVISGDPEREDTQKMLQALQQGYYPQLVLLLNPEGEKPSRIQALAPWLKDQPSLEGRATAYVCRNFTCQAPTTDLGQLLDSLK